MDQEVLTFNTKDLPKIVHIINDDGKVESYTLKPARRKFGAFLTKQENIT